MCAISNLLVVTSNLNNTSPKKEAKMSTVQEGQYIDIFFVDMLSYINRE